MLEYSLELHTLNLKEHESRRREGQNPFTGERLVFVAFEGMSASEVKALLSLLEAHGAVESDDEGSRSLLLSNGTRVGIRGLGRKPKAGIQAVQVWFISKASFSKVEATFLHQLALDGNLALCSSMDSNVVATVREVNAEDFKRQFKTFKVLGQPSELIAWMEKQVGSRAIIEPKFVRE